MDREIRFRGKDFTGNWNYGLVSMGDMSAFIIPVNMYGYHDLGINIMVKPETVGQFTGLHDKNGREIFEGDIVTMMRCPEGRCKAVPVRHVVFCRSAVSWVFKSLMKEVFSWDMSYFSDYRSSCMCEVIGNIFDNPELAIPTSLDMPVRKPRRKGGKGL